MTSESGNSVENRLKPARAVFPLDLAVVIGIAAVMVLICLTYFQMTLKWTTEPLQDDGTQSQSQPGMIRELAEAIVSRGSQLTGADREPRGWANRLSTGAADPADYMMRLFTSTAYLSKGSSDTEFISDAVWVLTGARPDQDALETAVYELAASGSRLASINDLVKSAGLDGHIQLPEDTTRLRTFNLADDLPEAGSEVVGLLAITSEVRLTGRQALFKIYSDARYIQSEAVNSLDPTIQNVYQVDWDSRSEKPGRHDLSMLILTNDGRGEWVKLNTYILPPVVDLETGKVQAGEMHGVSSWYSLPVVDGKALILMIGSDCLLELDMFDQRSRLLAQTTATEGQPAALRAELNASESPEPVYIRIRPGGGVNNRAVQYQLIPALAAARPDQDPLRLLAVLDINGDLAQIQDEDGKLSWQLLTGYQLIDPSAMLSSLDLVLPDGQTAVLAPAFDPGIFEYGLYIDAGTSKMQVLAETMEGTAARMTIENRAEKNSSGAGREIISGGMMVPEISRNELSFAITGFDGSERTYVVHILRSPESGGYHQVLELFPFSYRSALWLLHLKQPAWRFVPQTTNIEWISFIDSQDEGGRSLVNEDSSPAEWIETGSPVYDGSAWKAAARPVIEYFADPRNFFDETGIFQFEQLAFLPDIHTREGIEEIIANSFMAPGNEQKIDYAELLLQAGEYAGISPYFLASKIIQEMGLKGQSPLASGSLAGYEGAYNFYNIGSTPDPGVPNGALINGARFAFYGREPDLGEITEQEKTWMIPWTSPEKAITGGAIWIAERYVRIGQDTLYAQKFDMIEEDGLYIHQYAQNIQMAWAEGRRSQKAYAELDMLWQPFVFKIPVFMNMPERYSDQTDGFR